MDKLIEKFIDVIWEPFERSVLFGKNWLWFVLVLASGGLYVIIKQILGLSPWDTLLNPWFGIPSLLGLAGVFGYFVYLTKRSLPKDRFVVAIAKFHNVSEDCKDECNKLADRLRENLKQSAKEHNIEITVKTCKERLDSSEDDDIARARRLGMHRGAHIVIIGKVRKDEGEFSFEAKIVNRVGEQYIGGVQDIGVQVSSQVDLLSFKKESVGRIDEVVRFIVGLAFYGRKDYKHAHIIFKPLTIQSAGRYFFQGNSFALDNEMVEKKRYNYAIAAFKKSLDINPDAHVTWNNMGTSLAHLGKFEEAIIAYDEAIQIRPNDCEAWYNKGHALNNLKRYSEAVSAYNEVIKIKPRMYEAWYSKGHTLDSQGKYDEAIDAYDEALKIKPDKHAAWCNMGVAFIKLNRDNEALEAFKKAIGLNPYYAEAHFNRAIIFLLRGNKALALESLKKAIEHDMDGSLIVKAREMVETLIKDDPEFRKLVGLP